MEGEQNSLSCLICQSKNLEVSDQLLGADICSLWRSVGNIFPPEALIGIEPDSKICLRRCTTCGFEFFDPKLAGNGRFYQCLESSAYYSAERPEFRRTIQFANRHKLHNVLDIGCGVGDFLDLARQSGIQTFGIELNPTAAAKARAKGHPIFDQLLPDLPSTIQPDGFDLITLFQVLEHIADPVGILNQASKRLRQGGYLSVAVPNKSGFYRFVPWDPAQWPPHHVSRWCLKDFKTLAEKSGLQLLNSGGDMLIGSGIERQINFQHQLASALGKRKRTKPSTWPKVLSWLYRKSGMKYLGPRWGASIYANFQRV